jgi:hypothetical protein
MDGARAWLVIACLVTGAAGGVLVDRIIRQEAAPPGEALTELKSELRRNRQVLEEVAATVRSRECTTASTTTTAMVAPELGVKKAVMDALVERDEERERARAGDETPSDENLAAFQTGQQFLSDAIGRGRWTSSDEAELERVSIEMTATQRAELMRKLARAINQSELVPDRQRP